MDEWFCHRIGDGISVIHLTDSLILSSYIYMKDVRHIQLFFFFNVILTYLFKEAHMFISLRSEPNSKWCFSVFVLFQVKVGLGGW